MLVSDLLAAASAAPSPPTTEVIKLHRLYSTVSSPSLVILRHPRVLQVLTEGLFAPKRKLGQDAQQAYLSLLAIAASSEDNR